MFKQHRPDDRISAEYEENVEMRFIRVNTTPPVLVIRRDEAEELADAKSVDWDYVEVPTGKVELKDYINELVTRFSARPSSAPLSTICAGIRDLEAKQLAPVAMAISRRIIDLTD